ncbi:hypothetical protein [Hymenobacter sp. BT730]|uniref:hypothetical protein n=1 Tax=Hymenobacter sp. BT730 TaxID=3063332 RepID=UPI0026E0606B|nr:hypothetical protein [Hymenobacter sp. BT730]
MNEAHWHLLLNHTPILGTLFGLLVLAVGWFRQNTTEVRIGLIAILVAAVLCVPTQLTGEGAVEIVKGLPGITQALLQKHEEAAELGFWALEGTAVLALLALLIPQRQRLLSGFTMAATAVSFGLLVRAGYLGGKISHPEIRSPAVSSASGSLPPVTEAADTL